MAAIANKTSDKETTSVEEEDIKKGYWEHPAISVTILLVDLCKPACFPNKRTASMNNTAARISNASTALYSSPLKSFKKGIIENEKPGGKNQYVSKTGSLRFVEKYLNLPIPFPAKKFSA